MNPSAPLRYCPDLLHYARRMTREVMVGNVGVGGNNPVRVQSMITSDTRDTPACVAEVLGLAEAGCEVIRITAQTKIYAANLENIAREVRAAGCQVPLVADIHFKPDAAMEAAKWVEKIRVNPGNFVDKKKFEIREYSDAQYAEELDRIRAEFTPLVHLCKDLGRAMRIGTNHGSLSDRIMNRYGDTPLGMCESALEFARIARDHGYHNFVFSMKASNPKVMIEAYRLLVARLEAEGADWNYPIHLGVTEAGDGEDGRIKSAIGIGSLLADGIGDTIRVSLTEDAIYEIPVARALAAPFNERSKADGSGGLARAADWNGQFPGATYSVTIRLIDSLPPSTPHETTSDQADGGCWLEQAEIAEMVLGALKLFDGICYTLHAWSVMPDHVRAILSPLENHALDEIIPSWKSFTAEKANEILQRTGAFWQEESDSHLIKDEDDFRNQMRFVFENPQPRNASRQWTGSRDGLSWEDAPATLPFTVSYDPFSYQRRASSVLNIMSHELGGAHAVRVFTTQERWNALAHKISGMGDFKPEIIFEKSGAVEIDPRDAAAVSLLNHSPGIKLVTVADGLELDVIHAFRELAFRVDPRHPILLKDTLHPPQGTTDFLTALLPAAQSIGSLLSDGIGDAILVRGETAPGQSLRLAYNILQAAGTRIFKTDYVACPSCGRTLFNLQSTTQKIRAATGHLKGVRIAVMGCIVNGPGEMADADFGYVGGAPNKINLYVGKTAVKFNIPEADAVERLIDLIREHGKWVDAPLPTIAEF